MRLLALFFVTSLLLSTPWLKNIPTLMPLLHADVRIASPKALDLLWAQGIWIYNTKLVQINEKEEEICFLWEHKYHARDRIDPPEELETCIPKNDS